MADIHVQSGDGVSKWTLVFHFAVPDVDNNVGINYRTVLVNSDLGGSTSMTEGAGAGEIATAEKAQIEAGELYEHTLSVPIESGATDNAEMLALARELYARDEARIISVLQRKLKYYGYVGSKS